MNDVSEILQEIVAEVCLKEGEDFSTRNEEMNIYRSETKSNNDVDFGGFASANSSPEHTYSPGGSFDVSAGDPTPSIGLMHAILLIFKGFAVGFGPGHQYPATAARRFLPISSTL